MKLNWLSCGPPESDQLSTFTAGDMLWLLPWCGALGALLALCYVFLTWNFDHWRRRGVRGPKPRPLLGTYPSLLLGRQHFGDDLRDIYMQYRERESYVGAFLLRTPQLLVLEPQLVHEVFVSAFQHFENNDVAKLIDPRKDLLLSCNPFVLRGDEWRKERGLITPMLTSVSIKLAYRIMRRVCADLCAHIEQGMRAGGPLNGKELALRFTADNLCDCVLGIEAQSFKDSSLPVSKHIRELSEENTAYIVSAVLSGLYPQLLDHFRIKIFPNACDRFFNDLIGEAFSLRRRVHMERNDLMNQLLELQRQHGLSDVQLTSHAMTFLIDGLDTTASAISHCLLMLSRNPECQQLLVQELNDACDGDEPLPSFEKLTELPYLDACLHESMRVYPSTVWSAKTCTQAYTLRGTRQSAPLDLKPGDTVMIPIYGLHHDPNYYPQPEEFRPERFMPANGGVKKYRNMGVFLGFGDGPRQCLGMRLALVQSKAAIAAIVRRFELHANARTKPGHHLDTSIFVAMHNGGVWLDFVPRPIKQEQ